MAIGRERYERGTRMLAISHAEKGPDGALTGRTLIFGRGTYEGDLPYPGWEQAARAQLPVYRALAQEGMARSSEELMAEQRHFNELNVRLGGKERTEEELLELVARQQDRDAMVLAMDDDALVAYLGENGHYTNPCIKLDDGNRVWGMECWWGPEAVVEAKLAGSELVTVPLPENGLRS